MRPALGCLAGLLLFTACTAPEPVSDTGRARWVLDGFVESNAQIQAMLAESAAHVVFADVEEHALESLHEGLLFTTDGRSATCEMICSLDAGAPAGASYHSLVVLVSESDVLALETGSLELDQPVEAHPGVDLDLDNLGGERIVISTPRESLLFPAHPVRRELRLTAPLQ